MARARKPARRTSRVVVINPPKKRAARRHRRNPRGGFLQVLLGAGMDAVAIEGGRLASRILPTALNKALPADKQLDVSGAMGVGLQIASGVAAAFVAEKVRRGTGRLVLAGAMTAPLESLLAKAQIPIVSEALGAYPIEFQLGTFQPGIGTVGTVGSYPRALPSASGMGAYPRVAQQIM